MNPPILLDLGCGPNKRSDDNWAGIDKIQFPGVDIVGDVFDFITTVPDNTVDKINASHFVEHLEQKERTKLFNECHRVLKPNAKMFIDSPDWTCASAYGDPTHCWPPLSEWFFYYLNEKWRNVCAPHTDYTCNFDLLISKKQTKIIIIYAELTKV